MADMSKGEPHPSAELANVERPVHIARRDAERYAVAVDQCAKLHSREPDINGGAVIVLLGNGFFDESLAELAAEGISSIVADGPEIDLASFPRPE